MFAREDLAAFEPRHRTFVGIDSDGCVFDTMELKQKRCFHPEIIRHWGLERIEPLVRETAEFVNLYSSGRGRNRFPCLLDVFDLLRNRPEVAAAGVRIPEFRSLRSWIEREPALGNPTLEREVRETGNEELASVLAWSRSVNARVEKTCTQVRPFRGVRECLARMRLDSDIIVVSQTPAEALVREWRASGLHSYVARIAGQEMGTKTEHIARATGGRYGRDCVLMIGDAPGDLRAARENRALFYPIRPGHEVESWERLLEESYGRFLRGEYAAEYEATLVAEFQAALPEAPPWKSEGMKAEG